METKKIPLSLFRIREHIEGEKTNNFEDAIADTTELKQYEMKHDFGFDAVLLLARSERKQPPWVEFLGPGFGNLDEILDSVTNRALLMIKVKYYKKDIYFAVPFGFGRYLLKPNSYVRNYGLRVALNSIYKSGGRRGDIDPARIRSVDTKTVSSNTMHTRRQTNRRANFESFGVDVQRDLLRTVTGKPIEPDKWGARITGAHTLHLNYGMTLEDLGNFCKLVEKTYRRDDYRDGFSWIDNIHAVTDTELIELLKKEVLESLKSIEIEKFELAPPDLVDYDAIAAFRYSFEGGIDHTEMELKYFLEGLESTNRLESLDFDKLRRSLKIKAVDAGGDIVNQWSAYNCVNGEFEYQGNTYLLEGGSFYLIAHGYLAELNRYVENSLVESAVVLPDCKAAWDEGTYNMKAAESSDHYLLLDKKTVRISNRTSAIEICDILTDDRGLIHVKKKKGSSSLSHLYSQGYVSSDLLLMSREYREAYRTRVEKAEKERAKSEKDDRFINRFSTIDVEGISPREYEIVYAMIGDWKGKNLVDGLPFFSKVNLRRFADDLRRMGYRATYKRIQTD